MNARRFALAAWMLAALLAGLALAARLAGLRVSFSASAPAGIWHVSALAPQQVTRGALVAICPPARPIVLAMREQGYLHPGPCPQTHTTPFIKPVAAIAGDTVTVTAGGALSVNGRVLAGSAPQANVPAWPPGTYRVRPGEVWLLSRYSAGSFDSRYFGPVPLSQLRGQVAPFLVAGDPGLMTVSQRRDDDRP
jgi:conjugative transfer signal peptidase TraF